MRHGLVHTLGLIAAWGAALAWAAKLLESFIGLKHVPNLSLPVFDKIPAGEPMLTVIVPARNEGPNIRACLESLLVQDYKNLRIVTVDDRSDDQTGRTMDAVAAAYPDRLSVLHVNELPPGWLGKTHAMALAARKAIGEWKTEYLLFTDADILFSPEILRRSLAYAIASDADHFVVLPTTVVKKRGEGMILSYLQVMSLWAVRPWRIANPKSRDAIGVGAFNMLRTEAYLQLGGFDAMPMEILEDMTMGQRVKKIGLRQRMAYAPGAVNVHWAAGATGIMNGMTKNLFAVFRFRPVRLLGAAASMAMICLAPVAMLIFPGARIPGSIACVSVMGLYLLSARKSRVSAWYAALFPVSAALVTYSMLRSMAITLRNGGVTWRGTFYPLAELREGVRNTSGR